MTRSVEKPKRGPMRVEWIGGPLDGVAKTYDDTLPVSLWVGPDPVLPDTQVIVYLLRSDGNYHYDQTATNKANLIRRTGR